ncbi:MAG: response regulator [bacterium]
MRKRILVTDASEAVLDVCRGALTGRGYTAVCHSDGHAALREAVQGNCDLAVVATETAGMPGYELVGKLRQTDETKNLPILMLIGSSELLEPEELLNAGPDATLTKPFAPQELLHRVDSLLLRPPTAAAESAGGAEDDLTSLLETEAQFTQSHGDENDLRQFLNAISEEEERPEPAIAELVDRVELVDSEAESQLQETNVADDREAPVQTPTPEHEATIGLDEFDTLQGSGIYLETDDQSEQSEAEAIYLDRDSEAALLSAYESAGDDATKLKEAFVRELAQALAREIAAKIDFEKLLARLDENLTAKDRY